MPYINKPLPGNAWRGLFFWKRNLREGCEGRKVRSTGAKRTPEQPDPKGHAQKELPAPNSKPMSFL